MVKGVQMSATSAAQMGMRVELECLQNYCVCPSTTGLINILEIKISFIEYLKIDKYF